MLYTGSPIEVTYTVTDAAGNELVQGTDYTASITPWPVRDIGTYTLSITGVGDYTGSKSETFNVYAVLFSEDFEGGQMPEGWTSEGIPVWAVGTGVDGHPWNAGQGSNNAWIKACFDDEEGWHYGPSKLITPVIDLSAAATAELSFMHVQEPYDPEDDEYGADDLRVYYRTSPTGEWILLDGQVYEKWISPWKTEKGIVLPNLSSTYQLAFEYTCYEVWYHGIGIDNVRITQDNDCAKPTNLTIDYTGGTTSVVSWTSDASDFNLDVNGTIISNVTNPYTFENLNLASSYTIKVQAVCDNGHASNWSNPAILKTDLCPPENQCTISYVLSGGYEENDDFDKGDLFNWLDSYIRVVDVGTNEVLAIWTHTGEFWETSTGSLALCDGRQVRFEWYEEEDAGLAFDDYCTFTVYDAIGNIIFSGNHGFYSPVLYEHNCYACNKPENLTVNYTGGITAQLDWTSNAPAWYLDVNGTITTINEKPYTLTGLTLNTNYEVKVKPICDDENAEWSDPISFVTDLCMPDDQCILTIALSNAGDISWGDCALRVVDVSTGRVLGSFNESATYTLKVCNGRIISIEYIGSGDNQYLNGWLITDLNNEIISEHVGGDYLNPPIPGTLVTYTVDCTPAPCPKPLGLTVDHIWGNEVTLSWESEADAWQLCLNDDEDHLIDVTTKPYTIADLYTGTTYTVKVRANCGTDGVSTWSREVSFKTMNCTAANTCEISYELHARPYEGSYTYGWYNSGIRVINAVTEEIITTLTVPIHESTATGTLIVCDNSVLRFEWYQHYILANLDEMFVGSYTLYDANGDIILSGNGPMEGSRLHTVDCTLSSCHRPSGLSVSNVTNHTVDLSWTENGDATQWMVAYRRADQTSYSNVEYAYTNPYTIQYLAPETDYVVIVIPTCEVEKPSEELAFTTDVACSAPTGVAVVPAPTTAELSWTGTADNYEIQYIQGAYSPFWLWYDNDTLVKRIGGSTAQLRTWGVMYPASMLEGKDLLYKVSVFENQYYLSSYTVKIYTGGDNRPDELVHTETVIPADKIGFHEITLSSPVTIDPTKNLWIVLSVYGTYVKSACAVHEPNNQWSYSESDDKWSVYGPNSNYYNNSWMIRGFVASTLPSESSWTTVQASESPHTLTNLVSKKEYTVRVKSQCGGNDGESEWSEMALFTTPDEMTAPFNLEVVNVIHNSATLSWDGYQEGYQVQYGIILGDNQVNVTTNSLAIEDLRPNTQYLWRVRGRRRSTFGTYTYTGWSEIATFNTASPIIFLTDGNWNDGANWFLHKVPADDVDVTIAANTIIPAGYDAKVNNITLINGGSLTIKDGGQLHSNVDIEATIEKDIIGYTGTKDHYYLITNPLTTIVDPATTSTNLTTGNYDLYKYNGDYIGEEWRNYKAHAFSMVHGVGYLYANDDDITLRFTGLLSSQHTNLLCNLVELTYDPYLPLCSMNLVGNMYPHNGYVYLGYINGNHGVLADEISYYKTNDNGDEIIPATNEVVKPCEGIFVQATDYKQYALVSSVQQSTSKSRGLNMNVSKGDNIIDRAIVKFGQGNNLNKFQLNPSHTKLYLPQDDKDYAVINYNEKTGEIPLYFKASESGTYTLSFSNENVEFSYLHLIDHKTGADIDLLATPSYSFEGRITDYASRFKLVFVKNDDNLDNQEDFAFISNGEIIVIGEGILQIFDVLGHQLFNNHLSSLNSHLSLFTSPGVYVLRLINGENVRTQKIVVK